MALLDDAIAPFKSRRKMEERKGYTFFFSFFNPLLILKKVLKWQSERDDGTSLQV